MLQQQRPTYLCGSMEGIEIKSMKGWRQQVTSQLGYAGIPTLDPTRRIAMHGTDPMINMETFNRMHRIVTQDLQDIKGCSVLFANLTDKSGGKKWGSVMEVALAWEWKIPVIVYLEDKQFKHPFIYTMATEVHTDLDEAIDAVIAYYS